MSDEPDTSPHRYTPYTKKRALEAAARHRYELARQERLRQSEHTAESRKRGLMAIFESVDRQSAGRQRILERPTGNASFAAKNGTAAPVAKTEIVPMLPCKGYTLPRGNLFIGGKWPALDACEWGGDVMMGLEGVRDETVGMEVGSVWRGGVGEYGGSEDEEIPQGDSAGDKKMTFVFTQDTRGLCGGAVVRETGSESERGEGGIGWEEGVVWDNLSASAYL